MRRRAIRVPPAARTVVAIVVLVVAPAVPGILSAGAALAAIALPFESVAVLLVLVATPWVLVRRVVSASFGVFVVAAIVLAALDAGFRATVDHAFEPVGDGPRVADAYGVVQDAAGPVVAGLLLGLVVAAAAGGVAGIAWAALRTADVVRRHDGRGRAVLAAAVAVWTAFALAGADIAPGARFAASRAVDTVAATSSRTVAALREQAAFEQARRADPFRDVPAEELLAGLDGKDVVIAFVESYGRAAVEGTTFSAGVGRVLEDGGRQLERDGYSARSAFLTSPTFGGVSWLAHATLQSGLWVDSQLKYDQVTSTDRLTLAGAFGAAGWRTVADVPSNGAPWSVGASFYGYDAQLNARNVGYRGPAFSYARVPDQYTWKHFFDRELAAPHEPVMAEIDLVSSHTPWTPLPELVPWDELGDGSVFDPQPSRGLSPAEAWSDPKTVQRLYGESIEYSFGAMFSFLHEHDQPGLVLVVLGDHQPARIVSGPDAAADVPVTIIAQDRAVLDRIASWGWDEGVRPSPDAPVWRMDAFRDRFFRAFGAE